MKFIHTSDWHLGRFFHNESLLDDQKVALQQVIAYAQTHQVDAVVVAGDIFDRSIPPASAVELLDEVLDTLVRHLGIAVVMIPGNHDSAKRIRFGSKQLSQAGLHIIGDLVDASKPIDLQDKAGNSVHFYGIPFCVPEEVKHTFKEEIEAAGVSDEGFSYAEAHDFLVKRITQTMDKAKPNVLLSHCFVDGSSTSDSERPLSIGGSERVNFEPLMSFDYVALGHLHQPQYRGEAHIRYSGSLLKYSFQEYQQKKSVTLVELSPDQPVSIEKLPIKAQRDVRVLEGDLQSILSEGEKETTGKNDFIMAKLTDRRAILDVMGKLRSIYPNTLHIEKVGISLSGEDGKKTLASTHLKRDEISMFNDFYQQIMGEELEQDQKQYLEKLVSTVVSEQEDR